MKIGSIRYVWNMVILCCGCCTSLKIDLFWHRLVGLWWIDDVSRVDCCQLLRIAIPTIWVECIDEARVCDRGDHVSPALFAEGTPPARYYGSRLTTNLDSIYRTYISQQPGTTDAIS